VSHALVFVLGTLATARALRLLQHDTLLDRPRAAFYDRFPPDAKRAGRRSHWQPQLREIVYTPVSAHARPVSRLGQWLACPWCCGFWLSGLAVLGLMAWRSTPAPALWWPALSTAVALVDRAGA
jgi:hypothetical protein